MLLKKKGDFLFVNRISLDQTVKPLNEFIVNVAVLCFCCHFCSASSLVSLCVLSQGKQMSK